MSGIWIVGGHRWRVVSGHDRILVRVVMVIVLGISARWWGTSIYRHVVVEIIIHGEVRQRGLRKRFSNHFAFLVLQVGEITPCLFLSKLSGVGEALLLPALDNSTDTLKNQG